jgi:hypothetical protein
MMKVLAIDPGPTRSAYVVYAAGRIDAKGMVPNADMLDLVRAISLDRLVIEMVESFGMPVGKEVFETVFWIGRFIQAWEPKAWARVYRKEVKLHLCGNCRAKDPNIRQALLDRLGRAGTKTAPGPTHGVSKDMWSALAVAVTFVDQAELAVRGATA